MGKPDDFVTDLETSRRMQRIGRRDTKPEMIVRRLLHRRGMRYRVDTRAVETLSCRPDVVFRGAKVAVFIDSCYWHGCPQHGTSPKTNRRAWRLKIEGNRKRDRRAARQLQRQGWAVIRVWEHQDPRAAADDIERIVRSRCR